jgi:hypothetical protein
MAIRRDAISWFTVNVGVRDGKKIFTSKYFSPSESWTNKNAWWIQIPVECIRSKKYSHIHLLCQVAPSKIEFHHLRVPSNYFIDRLSDLTVLGRGRINLFLSAEVDNLFQDERGPGHVEFAHFVVSYRS